MTEYQIYKIKFRIFSIEKKSGEDVFKILRESNTEHNIELCIKSYLPQTMANKGILSQTENNKFISKSMY